MRHQRNAPGMLVDAEVELAVRRHLAWEARDTVAEDLVRNAGAVRKHSGDRDVVDIGELGRIAARRQRQTGRSSHSDQLQADVSRIPPAGQGMDVILVIGANPLHRGPEYADVFVAGGFARNRPEIDLRSEESRGGE